MTVRHHFVVWVVAGTAALFILVSILVWRRESSADRWNTFLVGDPHAGAETFQQKGCADCHSVLGVGGNLAPDLGLQGAAGSSMNELVTQMWNHAPRMWEQIRSSKINYPQFAPEEMANLFAYLYVTCYDDESGNRDHGKLLFTEKGCIRCHSIGGHWRQRRAQSERQSVLWIRQFFGRRQCGTMLQRWKPTCTNLTCPGRGSRERR